MLASRIVRISRSLNKTEFLRCLLTRAGHERISRGAVVRWPRGYSSAPSEEKPGESKSLVVSAPPPPPPPPEERFVPLTGRAIFTKLMQKPEFLTEDEQRKFEEFSLLLDNVIANQFQGVLDDLKVLFDPINPDKETLRVPESGGKQRQENEFWLLQKLAIVMEKANFAPLPQRAVEKALSEHQTSEGVLVSVDPSQYSVLKIWVLGRGREARNDPWYLRVPTSIYFRLAPSSTDPSPDDLYKRVVVAARKKGDGVLTLKAFKDIPVGGMEQLLPGGTIRMSKFDKSLLATFGAVGGASLLAKLVSYLAHIQVQWTLLLAGAAAGTGLQVWSSYMSRRNRYLGQLSQTLYFKNVANNRGLLSLLVDRARDEVFKEALLAYSFLLAHRPPTYLKNFSDVDGNAALHGGITTAMLEQQIEDWIVETTDLPVKFDSTNAVRTLTSLGLARRESDGDPLQVLSLDQARAQLPPVRQSMMGNAWQDLEIEPESFSTKKSKLRSWTLGWF